MPESGTSGSVRGASSNGRPYRDRTGPFKPISAGFGPFMPQVTNMARNHGVQVHLRAITMRHIRRPRPQAP
jgi:hypothetical protein